MAHELDQVREQAAAPQQLEQQQGGPLHQQLGGNQAMLADLGLDSPRPSSASPPQQQADAPAQLGTGYILARGHLATQGTAERFDERVREVVEAWGVSYQAGSVHRNAPEGGEATVELVWNPAWGDAPSTRDLAMSLTPVEAKVAVGAMRSAAGWGRVTADDQTRLVALIGGETNAYSVSARAALKPLVVGSRDTPGNQATALRGLISDANIRPDVVEETTTHMPAQNYRRAGPTAVRSHQFHGRASAANLYTMTFDDGQVIRIYEATRLDRGMQNHAPDQVFEALSRLPLANRRVLKVVQLNPRTNPSDAYWAVEYNDPNFHSYMTSGVDGVVTIYPDTQPLQTQDYMNGTMIHESGHTWAAKKWGADQTRGGWVTWRQAMTRDGISVADYATASIDEDVSETLTVYGSTRGTPRHAEYRAMVPNRFAILDADFQ